MSLSSDEKALLDAIEQLEMRSLAWGYVDGSLDPAEAALLARDGDAGLVDELIAKHLLFKTGNRLRSRFAETVRLLTKNRQIFEADKWREAPRLVADFRIDRRPRLFPKREIAPGDVWDDVPPAVRNDSFRRAIWDALTCDAGGKPLELARFQARCVARLLAEGRFDTAAIVTAGTGSGKTYCFYLPTLVEIAANVARGSTHTLALALYPRTELLKDQLRAAIELAGRLRPVLESHGKRALRVGVFYGDTPENWKALKSKYGGWEKAGDAGFICPSIRCPSCEGDLVWHKEDAEAGVETLRCASASCRVIDELVLTRESLRRDGCDLLFITTESLNRRMADAGMRGVLGIDRPPQERPLFVLLDEVHTYAGTTGAQVTMTLHRWRHAVGDARIRWVGLSATLHDPEAFFATVTGVRTQRVRAEAPTPDETYEDGCEYQVVLRGDPSSQTSLLSTTIQTAMLAGRVVDTATGASGGTVGRKVFVFTDDLDGINRLYHDLAEAEGYRYTGSRLTRVTSKPPLASFRGPGDDAGERDVDGQRWWAPERIGHDLSRGLRLDRTTSQDAGVDVNATVVVATGSLEVGFNDPSVGFVVQHKAPHSAASFLQRKGRAGRVQQMRPWMITALSDYGRDRAAFESFEQLFDPTVAPMELPVDNLYVLRIQATFALLEWLYEEWDEKPEGVNLWDIAGAPRRRRDQNSEARKQLALVLKELLREDRSELRANLTEHLKNALGLDKNADRRLEAILWQPPRGLMLEVVPTLIRHLYCDWRPAFPRSAARGLRAASVPLPEFMPANQFSDLQLPEVQIEPRDGRPEGLGIAKALKIVVPGRVTRRFAPHQQNLSHWIPIDDRHSPAVVALERYVRSYERLDLVGEPAVVVRPRTVAMEPVPTSIKASSNARWEWTTRIVPGSGPVDLPRPRRGPWAGVVTAIEAHVYRRGSPAYVARYAVRGEATIKKRGGDTRLPFELRLRGEPAGIGFEQEVDGVRIELAIPGSDVIAARIPDDVAASCRSALFRKRVREDQRLAAHANVFQLDWLAQAFLAAAVSAADAGSGSFADACASVDEAAVNRGISMLFPAAPTHATADPGTGAADDEPEEEATVTPADEQRLVKTLRGILAEAVVVGVLCQLAAEAAEPPEDLWNTWLRSVICDTMSAAFRDAAVAALPRNSAADTLLADWTADGANMTLWLTEQSLGGAGIVEELITLVAGEPRKLLRSVDAALAPTELERASEAMALLCCLIRDDDEIAALAERCSQSVGHGERAELIARIASVLRGRGYAAARTFGVSANARLFRTRMTREMWSLLADLDEERARLQSRLGVVIDLRVFCRIAAAHPAFGPRLRQALGTIRGANLSAAEAAQILSGMLWPQVAELRAGWRGAWHPFREPAATERELVRAMLAEPDRPAADVSDSDWRAAVTRALMTDGVARLSAANAHRGALAAALLSLSVDPVDAGWLLLYAGVERIELRDDRLTAVLNLREIT